MSNRAPDGQPTSNIRTVLAHAKSQLDYWESSKASDERALERSTRMVTSQRLAVQEWEGKLANRLQEEQEAVEVNGL